MLIRSRMLVRVVRLVWPALALSLCLSLSPWMLGCSALTKPNEISILGEGQKPGVAAPTAPPPTPHSPPAPRTLRPSPPAGH